MNYEQILMKFCAVVSCHVLYGRGVAFCTFSRHTFHCENKNTDTEFLYIYQKDNVCWFIHYMWCCMNVFLLGLQID